jgi:5-methylcytosine-specific restriction endonuclease McrA
MVMLSSSFARKAATGSSRAGGDLRGNSAQRRARKGYLLTLWGNGELCPCIYGCGRILDHSTIEADRIIPGSLGGSYVRSNVIPACRSCNVARLDKTLWSFAPNVARRLKRMGYVVSARSATA